jgi:hypothetical protein
MVKDEKNLPTARLIGEALLGAKSSGETARIIKMHELI